MAEADLNLQSFTMLIASSESLLTYPFASHQFFQASPVAATITYDMFRIGISIDSVILTDTVEYYYHDDLKITIYSKISTLHHTLDDHITRI